MPCTDLGVCLIFNKLIRILGLTGMMRDVFSFFSGMENEPLFINLVNHSLKLGIDLNLLKHAFIPL